MTIETLTTTLASRGVTLYLEDDALRFRAPKGALTAALKAQIAEHRAEILGQLRTVSASTAELHPARCRCDIRHWVDEPPQDGRIRTHCGNCARFIGYRPEILKDDRNKALEHGRYA